ncbi:MAG: alpha/beta hydrolase [Burkholderiales bacterium]|nr:alpha/beta hydrolase [Burkholderiales bacterium]
MATTAPAVAAPAGEPAHFTYFPGHYRWSAEMLAVLSTAPYGGAEISEAHRIGRELRAHLGDDDAWFRAWSAGGDRLRERAERAESAGHRITAASVYLRACCQYQHAEHFRHPKDAAALDVFRRSIDCFHRFAALTDGPRIEPVEIAYRHGRLPAYFVHPERPSAARSPCVVRFGGFDTQKELQYVRGVGELARRGFAVLLVDGPGMGEAIRFRGIRLHGDYELVGTACLDYLATRPDVDTKRVAVLALSLGGYYAPRCAALDERYAACVAWGAQWDVHELWVNRLKQIREGKTPAMPVPADHVKWVFGAGTFEEAVEKFREFRLDGVVQKMRCPFLLTHGTEDQQVSMAVARKLHDSVGSKDKTFRIYTPEEGGAQHCQRDYLTLVCDDIGDWLEEKIGALAVSR